MYYRNSYFRLSIYLFLLILLSGALFLLLQASSWYALLPAMGVVWMIFAIVRIFNLIPEKIAYFFNAIENEDSTLLFSEETKHKPTKEMNKSLNRVNRLVQEVKLKNREQEQYYSMLLEQAATGIVVINDFGNILQANSSAKKLLNYRELAHVEQLKRVDMNLHQAFLRLKESTHQFVKVAHKEGVTQLSLQSTTFRSQEETLRVISVHDISNELDAKELESWQKLIRVLTHEIMNSITPITSLSETLLKYYIPREKAVDEKTVSNTVKGLEVINERGVGLIRFVESYRKLTRLSSPILKPIALKNFIEHLLLLLENEPDFHRISFRVEFESPDMCVDADETQLSQVFINLIKNAMQAVENVPEPQISVSVRQTEDGHCEIKIADNGSGISPEVMEHIFIPFFTTKENGSGIGLSLSRQIIKNHGGGIDVISSPGNTVFTLSL